MCPRCKGKGWVTAEELLAPPSQRPGIVKATPEIEAPAKKKASA